MAPREDLDLFGLKYLVIDVHEKQKKYATLIMKGGSVDNFTTSFKLAVGLYHWLRVRSLKLRKLIFFMRVIPAHGVNGTVSR